MDIMNIFHAEISTIVVHICFSQLRHLPCFKTKQIQKWKTGNSTKITDTLRLFSMSFSMSELI